MGRRLSRAAAVGTLLLTCALVARTATAQPLRGVVVDQTGLPLPGVTVQLRDGDRVLATTTTRSDGSFEFLDVLRGRTIVASLDGFETVQICTGYKLDGKKLDYLPAHAADQERVEPVFEEIEGWPGSTRGARSWAELPARAIKYVRRIEELIRCPVALVSTSPERDDTILVRDPFAG